MAAKIVYPVKMKSVLLYNDLTWSGVDILRNVEKSMWGHLKLTLYRAYTPKSAQNSLNSMIQLKYEHDHDPVKLAYDFAVALCLL
jgi:hypothetical protein